MSDLPRCKTCKHWHGTYGFQGTQMGVCNHPQIDEYASTHMEPLEETREDFGCVLHEVKHES